MKFAAAALDDTVCGHKVYGVLRPAGDVGVVGKGHGFAVGQTEVAVGLERPPGQGNLLNTLVSMVAACSRFSRAFGCKGGV